MKSMKGLVARESGFTLVEMTVVIAIIAVLAALALPAVTGVTTDTRTSSKAGDIKEVEQAVTRYESDNGSFPVVANAFDTATTVSDTNGDGTIKILLASSGTLWSGSAASTSIDVQCGSFASTTLAAAIADCFSVLSFTTLVPNQLKSKPKHSSSDIAITSGVTTGTGVGDNTMATADLTITNCNLNGDDCEFYLMEGDDLTATDVFKVWQINQDGTVFAFKEDSVYGSGS